MTAHISVNKFKENKIMGRLYHNGQPVVNINHGVADSSDATAIASDILATKTAYINNQKATGTMPNNGAVSQTLNAGGSYTIPQGYHNGSGKVTANSLASQTQGTANASDIAKGLTAWANGVKLTGTKEDVTATITVTYDSRFYNKTMTCTKGTKTYTKTTTSSGSTTFNVNEEGTWTITCNGVSRTVNVVLSYSTQMAITKTVTIYGAKEDYITYTDATGSKVCQFASGATSKSVSITFIPPSATITFTSTVAKNPNNLSQNYSKAITITDSTTDIYVMPDNVLYWYGYVGSNLENITSANGYSTYYSGYTYEVPTYNTNNITMSPSGNTHAMGLGVKNALASISKVNVIAQGVTILNDKYGFINAINSKSLFNYDLRNTATNVSSTSIAKLTHTTTSTIPVIYTDSCRAFKVYAIWTE